VVEVLVAPLRGGLMNLLLNLDLKRRSPLGHGRSPQHVGLALQGIPTGVRKKGQNSGLPATTSLVVG